MNKLFIDTETTGLPDFRTGVAAVDQPDITQIAALLTTDQGEEISGLYCYVFTERPIDPKASQVTGITNELLKSAGVNPVALCSLLLELIKQAGNTFVCHNTKFDHFLMQTMFRRHSALPLPECETECTMLMSQDVCQLPLTDKQKLRGITGYKQPRLEEAYRIVCGKELVGAHDALADVRACKEIYFKMLER